MHYQIKNTMTYEVIVTVNNGDRFGVIYGVEKLSEPLGNYIDIKKVFIGTYELEFYDLKICHEEVFNELLEACKNSYQNNKTDKNDLEGVNIG